MYKRKKALQLQQFEKLRGDPRLCSIRHVSKDNPRVLFVFTEGDDAIVLLSCVLEKSKNDYNEAIAQAKRRLAQLEED